MSVVSKLFAVLIVGGPLGQQTAVATAQTASAPSQVFFGVRPGETTGAGAAVADVAPGGTGAALGLHAGDVIVAMNGQSVADTAAMVALIGKLRPGEPVTVRVRRGSETIDLSGTAQAGTPVTAPRRVAQ